MDISVALPVFNGAQYLGQALESILTQEFSDFELVVSDNCSTDATPDILSEYARQDNRLRVSRAQTFLSQAENVNRTVELCSGVWVKLICHDDIMQANCLASLNRAIQDQGSSSVGLIGNSDAWLFSNGYKYNPVPENEAEIRIFKGTDFIKELLRGSAKVGLPSLTSATVKKVAWSKCGKFDWRFVHFDVYLWARLLMRWDYLFVHNALTVTRIHGAQVAVSARKSLRSVNDHRLFWNEFMDEFGEQLELSTMTRMKTRLKSLATAGTGIAIEILKRNFSNAWNIAFKMPLTWWPLLPVVVARSLKTERKRIAPIRSHVPVSLIYPG